MSLHLGTNAAGDPIEFPPAGLLRHAVCLGSSGSGKTVACKAMVEELLRAGIPGIAIDPQGDIACLGLAGDPAQLAEKGVDATRLAEFQAKAEVVVWTPASSSGVPLAVNPLDALAEKTRARNPEDRVRALSGIAQQIAGVIGYDLDTDDGRGAAAGLHLALDHIAAAGLDVRRFEQLADFLGEPPEAIGESLAKVLPERKREQLRRRLSLVAMGPQQLLFGLGTPLSIDTLLGLDHTATPGKTRVSVIYLNCLHGQAEKEFLVAQVAQALYDWMLDHPSALPQAFFYLDEAAPFIPPIMKPACKDALSLLYKQARKYGIACIVASQNPGDLDYRCLAQFSTWFLGRLLVQQDVKKVEAVIRSLAGADTERIVTALPSLAPCHFRLLSPDHWKQVVELKIRWLYTAHRTLDEEAIGAVTPPAVKAVLLRLAAAAAPVARAAKAAAPAAEPAPAEVEDEPAPEEEADLEPPPLGLPERLESHLVHSRRAWTVVELSGELDAPEAAVRRALKAIATKIAVERGGRCNYYWARRYKFFPDRGVTGPVKVAKLVVYERDAMATATRDRASFFGLIGPTLGPAEFAHLPLWQIALTVVVEKGILFWREFKRRGEYLYFDATTGHILVATSNGIELKSVVDTDPAQIRDLDDVASFEERTPDEVGLTRKSLGGFLSEREVASKVARKYPVTVEGCQLVFLPYWRFPVPGGAPLAIDGVLGRPFRPPIA